jgi:hypothetical protein
MANCEPRRREFRGYDDEPVSDAEVRRVYALEGEANRAAAACSADRAIYGVTRRLPQ